MCEGAGGRTAGGRGSGGTSKGSTFQRHPGIRGLSVFRGA